MACTGAPKSFQGALLEDFDPSLVEVEGVEPIPHVATNVFITGQTGRGKTHLAVALARGWVQYSKFTTTIKLTERIRQSWQRGGTGEQESHIIDEMENAQVLVMDDLGAERADEKVSSVLVSILKGRYDSMLATIITSNLTRRELATRVDPRISAIVNGYLGIKLTGQDRRAQKKGVPVSEPVKTVEPDRGDRPGLDCFGQSWETDTRVQRWLDRTEAQRRELYADFLRTNARIGKTCCDHRFNDEKSELLHGERCTIFKALTRRDLGGNNCNSVAYIEEWLYQSSVEKKRGRREND